MIDFFDSSVLISLLSANIPEHKSCSDVWDGSTDRVIYSHGILETFSQLTGGRLGEAIPPDLASDAIRVNLSADTVKFISFDANGLFTCLAAARRHGVRGGAIYDYMHLCAARQAGADRIFTLNKRHFIAIAPDLALKIFHPSDVSNQEPRTPN